MKISFTTKYTGAVPVDLRFKQRDWNKIVRKAWTAVGRYWHQNFRKKHFTKEGARVYGYAKRSDAYTRRKQREKGHQLPLVWSGRSRGQTKVANVKARATRKKSGVRVSMNAPTLNLGGRRWGGPELTTVSAPEMQRLIEVLDAHIDRGLRRNRRKRITHIR